MNRVDSIKEELRRLEIATRKEEIYANVSFGYSQIAWSVYSHEEQKKSVEKKELADNLGEYFKNINESLEKADTETCLQITVNLFDLWVNGSDEEVAQIFKELANLRQPQRVILTLTGNGRQLRVWHDGRRRYPEFEHTDSAGHGLLFGIYGHPIAVKRYLDEFTRMVPAECLQRYNR